MITTNKWLRSAIYAFVGAFVGVFILLCITVSEKNKTIKRLKSNYTDQTEYVANLRSYADSMAKLECVTVNTTIVMNNKGLVNVNQTNAISRTVAEYTRGEVIAALDSINKTK